MSKRKAKANRYKSHPQVRLTRRAKKHLKTMAKLNGRDQIQQLSRLVCDAYAKMDWADDE